MMLLLPWEYVLEIEPTLDIHVFENLKIGPYECITTFINKTKVIGMMTMTLSCRDQVLLRNLISHPVIFPSRHQIPMAYPVEWVMDPPEFEWEHDLSTNTIVATTTMVVVTSPIFV